MNKDLIKLLVLKSIAANLPIIRAWNYAISLIPTIIVPKGETQNSILLLRNFNLNIRKSYNSDFIFHCTQTQQEENSLISNIVDSLRYDLDGTSGLNVIITEDIVVSDPSISKFFLMLDSTKIHESFDITEIVPNPQELETIHLRFLSYINEKREYSNLYDFLYASVFLFEQFIIRNPQIGSFDEVLSFVDILISEDEDVRESNTIPEVFVKELYKCIKERKVSSFYPILAKSILSPEQITSSIFYDTKYFYLSDDLFKIIANSMLLIVPVNALKQLLKESNILSTNECASPTYVVKVRLFNHSENRYRMLRFSFDKVNRDGSISFMDFIKINSNHEGGNDESH